MRTRIFGNKFIALFTGNINDDIFSAKNNVKFGRKIITNLPKNNMKFAKNNVKFAKNNVKFAKNKNEFPSKKIKDWQKFNKNYLCKIEKLSPTHSNIFNTQYKDIDAHYLTINERDIHTSNLGDLIIFLVQLLLITLYVFILVELTIFFMTHHPIIFCTLIVPSIICFSNK